MTAKGTVLITGGSRGIGAATVRLAAKRGYTVCFSYRSNTRAAEQLVQEVEATGCHALGVQSDVGDGDAARVDRLATPKQIAEPIMWLLSDEARYIAGEILLVSGGR